MCISMKFPVKDENKLDMFDVWLYLRESDDLAELLTTTNREKVSKVVQNMKWFVDEFNKTLE